MDPPSSDRGPRTHICPFDMERASNMTRGANLREEWRQLASFVRAGRPGMRCKDVVSAVSAVSIKPHR